MLKCFTCETFETLLSACFQNIRPPFPPLPPLLLVVWDKNACNVFKQRQMQNHNTFSISVDEKEFDYRWSFSSPRNVFSILWELHCPYCLISAPDYRSLPQNLAAKCWIFAICKKLIMFAGGAQKFHFPSCWNIYWCENAGGDAFTGVSLLSSFNTGGAHWHLVFFIGEEAAMECSV